MPRKKQEALHAASTGPLLLALFQKRIDGDDALLELARLRFQQAQLGVEIYAGSVQELNQLLDFKPWPEALTVAHLPRGIDLLSVEGHEQLLHFVEIFSDRVYGFVVHDQPEIASRPELYKAALGEINSALTKAAGRPLLFIEYAVGLDPAEFCMLIESIKEFDRVSACLDVGHLGIQQIRQAFRQKHPKDDICTLDPADPRLPELIGDVQEAVLSVPNAVAKVIRRLGKLGRPLHFHLHDGHPLSTLSHFGVSDHLSFFQKVSIPFPYNGKKNLDTMFGPTGLKRIVREACKALPPGLVSFTLEIHPTSGRLALADGAELFSHWTDKTNAERMNSWLETLRDNHRALSEICQKFCEGGKNPSP